METSDPAAVAAAVGTWVLETVNGKPLPFVLPTKVTLNTGSMTFNADSTFTAGGTWTFDSKAGSSGEDGTFLAADTRLTMLANGATDSATVVGDTLTILGYHHIGESDVYVYKRAAPGTVPVAQGSSGDPVTELMVVSQAMVTELGLRRYPNGANARGRGFAQAHATGTTWTMWPDVSYNVEYTYAIFVSKSARNPRATITTNGETNTFVLQDQIPGKFQALTVKVKAQGQDPLVEAEINYNCETPEMALLAIFLN